MQVIKHFFMSLVVAMTGLSCFRSPSSLELVGYYDSDYKLAAETLVLYSNGHFSQEVKLKHDGNVEVSEGKWRYNHSNKYIVFENNFMLVLDGFHKLNQEYANPKSGLVILPVSEVLGKITIGTSDGVIYNKRK